MSTYIYIYHILYIIFFLVISKNREQHDGTGHCTRRKCRSLTSALLMNLLRPATDRQTDWGKGSDARMLYMSHVYKTC